MSSIIDDESLRLAFAVQQQPGVYALLLGSGLSSSAGIPTGWAITIDLIRRVGVLRGEAAERTDAEWETWYRDQTGRAPDYSALLAELGPRPAERQSIIASYIEPSVEDRAEGRKLSTQAHHAIARLVAGGYIRVIVTTNFDRLLENALRDAGVEPVVIASPDQCNGARPLQHVPAGSCTVIKLHGDYLDVRSLNTAEELEFYEPAIETLLARVFDEYGLITCGWSGVWDTALRKAILRAPSRRYSTWWASLGPLAPLAEYLARHRDAQLVTIDGADGFFTRLADQVQLIDKTRQPPPATVELLVATAKRYLAKPEHHIPLADLVRDQMQGIADLLRSSEMDVTADFLSAAFIDRVRLLDMRIEGLASVLFLIGRWGDEDADHLLRTAIRDLYALSQQLHGEGDGPFFALLSYPATICFAMASAGYVMGERWRAWQELTTLEIHDRNDTKAPLVERLLSTAWEVHEVREAPWWPTPDAARDARPFQVHLLALQQRWIGRIIGTASDIQHLLDWTDLLASFLLFRRGDIHSMKQGRVAGLKQPVYAGRWAHGIRRRGRLVDKFTPMHPMVSRQQAFDGWVDLYKQCVLAGDGNR